jgi:hypothetical protein
MGDMNGNAIQIGRILWDAQGNEWKVVRLYVARGEAMLRDKRRQVTRTFHPVYDRGQLEVIA